MRHHIFLATMLVALPVMQGCTTSNAMAVAEAPILAANAPGGTVGCLAPKIVTIDGKCEAPKRLSWK
jgi:hypothetical protein